MLVCFLSYGGGVGNIIAFWALGKLTRQITTTFLLRGLAVSDICVLLNFAALFCFWYVGHFSPAYVRIVHNSRVMGYLGPIRDISIMANVWTTVVVGMNRYIALCRPLEAASLCTTSRARRHMICIVLSITFGLPAIVDAIFRDRHFVWCYWYYYIYLQWFIVMFRSLIFFCMLLFYGVRIIITLRAYRRQQLGRYRGRPAFGQEIHFDASDFTRCIPSLPFLYLDCPSSTPSFFSSYAPWSRIRGTRILFLRGDH